MFVGSPHTYTWIATAILATVLVGCAKNDDSTGHWSDPVAIAADSGFQQPDVAVLGQSQRLAVWTRKVRSSEALKDQKVEIPNPADPSKPIVLTRKVDHEITRIDILTASSADGQLWSSPSILQQGGKVHTRTIKHAVTGELVSDEIVDYPVDSAPQLAAAANGDAVATWTQTDGTLTSVFAARYSASSQSWSTVTEIDGTETVNASSPQAIMLTGSAPMVVFARTATDGSGAHEIMAALWSADAWTGPTVLSTNKSEPKCRLGSIKTCNAAHPRLAGNGNGTAFAIWEQESDTVSVRIDPITKEVVIDPITKKPIEDISVSSHVYAKRYADGAWQGDAKRLSVGTTAASHPTVAVNASGDAWAGWEQKNSNLTTQDLIARDPTAVWVMPYVAGTGWIALKPESKPLKTDDLSNQPFESFGSIDLVLDAAGTVTAAWEGQQVAQRLNGERPNAWNNTDVRRIWAARKTAAGAWDTPTIINSYSTFELGRAPLLGPTERRDMSTTAPRIVLVDDTRVAVAWTQWSIGRRGDSGPRIHSSFYQTGTGWSAAERVSTDVEITEEFAIAADGQGRAVATWSTDAGLRSAEMK